MMPALPNNSIETVIPTVLLVFPWCLDRVGHGNVQRVLAMADYLSRHGVIVDLVYQGNPGVPSREDDLTGFRRILRVEGWKSSDDARITSEWDAFYCGHEPPAANLTPGTALTTTVRGLLDAFEYTAVISSYAWTAPIFAGIAPTVLRIVDLHDIISLHGARSERATGHRSPFSLPEDTEEFLWRQWDVLLAITHDEARTIAPVLRPSQKLVTARHAVSTPDLEPSASNVVLYMGSDNPSNQTAVSWLLERVWPSVMARQPNATLRLVGPIGDAVRKTPLASTPGVEIVGFVERPTDELARAAVCVAPYLYGSGLKIKVIEAAAAGRIVVTTTVGVEGSGLERDAHVLVADDAEAFATAIVRALDDRELCARLASAARTHVRREFSADACYGPIVELLRRRVMSKSLSVAIPTSVEERISRALTALGRPPVVLWGNGSHTRALVALLQQAGAHIRGIVDKSAVAATVSPEQLQVVPACDFMPVPGDLIVMSSQTYESEMWEDLAPARHAGAHVLALYRRDCVTGDLKRLLRVERDEGRRVALTASPTARLVVAEPSAGRSRGPFFRFARSLRDAAKEAGVQVVVAGARRLSLQGLEADDRDLWEPTFEFAHWDALREADTDVWRTVARFAGLCAVDLERLTGRLSLAGNDVVLFHTANLIDVFGVVNWLSVRPAQMMPQVTFLFHFLPAQEARWLNATESEVIHAYQIAFALVAARTGHEPRLLAQNHLLADALGDALDRPVHAMGFPVPARVRAAASVFAGSSPRVLYAGEARADKGFGRLPAIADALAPELNAGHLTLVCQATPNEFADDRIVEAMRALAARPGVEVVDRFLPSTEYDDLVGGCDLVLLPYDPEQYRARLSAVFVDATCAGVPVVVPAGTWMSDQLDRKLGAGSTFESLDPALVADAVRTCLASLTSIGRQAQDAAACARRQHDPHAVLDTILTPAAPRGAAA